MKILNPINVIFIGFKSIKLQIDCRDGIVRMLQQKDLVQKL